MTASGPGHLALPAADVLTWPRPGSGLVTIGCHVARAAPETAADAGLAALGLRGAARGAGGLDARGLALAFERLGGSLLPSAGPDTTGFAATVLAEHLGEAARLLSLVLETPAFDPGAVARERRLLVTEAEQLRDEMGRWPLLLALRGAFGPTGYGLPATGLPAALAGLDAPRAEAWHHGAFGGRRTVVVTGDAEAGELAEAGSRLARPGAAAGRAPDSAAWAPLPVPAEVVEERTKAQTAIALVFPGPARADPHRRAAEAWAAVAGGLGGRLFEALRGARSLAYSVVAGALPRRHWGRLTAYLATSPEREGEAREALAGELARFRESPPTAAELVRARAYLAGQAQVARQRTAALANELLDAWLRGGGLGELDDVPGAYRAVTEDQVWEVARELDPAKAAVGVVRGSGR